MQNSQVIWAAIIAPIYITDKQMKTSTNLYILFVGPISYTNQLFKQKECLQSNANLIRFPHKRSSSFPIEIFKPVVGGNAINLQASVCVLPSHKANPLSRVEQQRQHTGPGAGREPA